ncbi:MAG: ParB/RepB/Spo0J family partition protein [Gammaproteobacteria bacterium]|nr:ParB/RepB/Spo0J family partition protein [Gammaproteobacteria bacterium]MCW5582799.1 ParB/RepB/Spo0J family partition protein [Gammaproteobacteria bacterium]
MLKRRPTLQQLPIDLLVRGKYQPRQHFDPDKLRELADSIKSTGGLLQPIVVRPAADNQYEIVAGERRWRAAQLAALADVSCLVCQYTDEQALQAAIVENISRTDLNPIEEAQAYQRLIEEFHYLHEEVAASVGKSRTAITNSLRLLKLDLRVQQLLITGQLSEGHGKILAGLEPHDQVELAQRCAQKGWNVRKMEMEAKKLQQATMPNSTYSDANVARLETAISEHIGNRTQIEYEERGGGYIHIRFNNIDELEGHFERMGFKYED